jgi:tRNA dimethylallyltransferase
MSVKPKIVVICGPTAVGKSDFAVAYALKHNGEVISADSRQVYKGLNIGSGKITKKEMKGVSHYLLDIVSPKKIFTVSDFQKLGGEAIKKILAKKKLPIICGGTGFYIDALVSGVILPEVKPNKELRTKIQKLSTEKLFKMLEKLDSARARTIDKHNKVRLIRAIEIAKALGKVPLLTKESPYEVTYIGLTLSGEILKERIRARLLKRLKQGMITEAKNLHRKGLSWKRMEALGLEYKYLALFLQGKISKPEMIENLLREICQYAKRQMTWFKRNEEIKWKKI